MTEINKKDEFLLSYLKRKYNAQENTALYYSASLLLQRLWQGSICISLEEIKEELKKAAPDLPQTDLESHLKDSNAVGKKGEIKPLILDEGNLYIQRYFVYQSVIVEKIEKIADNGRLHIITGGPGTGKTTSLSEILKNKLDKRILLAAPTGKAANRMKESLSEKGINLPAKTIHRMLGSVHLSVNFRRTKESPLEADIIAVDECSMIDIPLMAKLLDAVPDSCSLYLLGDKNQLSPIGAGTVFADICEKFRDKREIYTELMENFRVKSMEIFRFSENIRDKELDKISDILSADSSGKSIIFNEMLSIDEMYDNYSPLLNSDNPKDALELLKKYQVLCAVKNGKNGTININKELHARAKKDNALFTPLIIIENNYTQNLFNGDIGVMDGETAYFKSAEDSETKKFPLSSLPGYEIAFAITIHKSQGSEYNKVAVVFPDSEISKEDRPSIFTRELLYTAVTRAETKCFIYGSREILLKSCEKFVYKASGINKKRG